MLLIVVVDAVNEWAFVDRELDRGNVEVVVERNFDACTVDVDDTVEGLLTSVILKRRSSISWSVKIRIVLSSNGAGSIKFGLG